MNRIIKFRAFDKTNHVMAEIDDLDGDFDFIKDGDRVRSTIRWQDLFNGHYPDVAVMQFTGLLDKNKKEIYEGDVCRGPNGKYWVIEWMGYSWCMTNETIPNGPMKFAGSETYTIDKWMALPPSKQDLEIVGNIHEHNQLING